MNGARQALAALVMLAFCLAALPLTSFSASALPDTVFVRMPAAAYKTAAIRAVNALDYDSFVWLELATSDFARLQASRLPYEVYAAPYTLRLGEQSCDTRQGGPNLPAGWDSVRNDGPDLHLVQFIGPIRAEWLENLRGNGLEIVQYVHPFTYIVWGELDTLEKVTTADFVHWTGPFAPAYRVLPEWRNLSKRPYQVDVLLHRGADTDAAVRSIEELGGQTIGRAVLNNTFEIASFIISGTQLQAASQVPGVYSIQLEPTDGGLRGEMSNQVNVNNVDGSNQAFPGYLNWLISVGLNGSGVIIADVDDGVQDTHPDLVSRVISCTGQTCGGAASSSHGTHTAGIMVADGSSGVKDGYGFLRGLGMAPGANLVEQVYREWFPQPGGMLLLMTDSYNNGASLSNNSWGPSGFPHGYDNDTMQVDIGVRDAAPDTPGNQPLNYLLALMNGYGGTSSQGTPDEAKNIFTIGSTKMQTSSGAQDLDINDLSIVTAHGPALDGRTIPHMVAPGRYVDSTVEGSSYGLMGGNSAAVPHVSGAVALFIEYYRNLFGMDPSPALVKAAFLPVAHDLAGNEDADGNIMGHPFDSKQGWGRMDTAAVISPTVSVQYFDGLLTFDNTGEEWIRTLSVADPSKPVRLMLVWTDAPGHGLGGSTPAWNNNLDLVVEAGGFTYRGNDFGSDGWSQADGSADDMNNTEGVFLGPTASGDFTVRVIASNINSDGIFNQGDDTDQDFALVCYNCVGGADFALSAEPDVLEVCAPEIVTSTIRVGEIVGTYSCPVTLEVMNVPAGVTAEITPTVVIPTGEAILTLDVDADTADGEYTLIVSGTAEITNVHTTEISLTVGSAPLVASLESDPGVSGLPVHFTVTLAAGTSPLTYTWSCGGPGCGTGLDTATPVYTYSIPGTFTVVLTVENKYGSDVSSNTVTVCQPVEDVTVNGPGNLLTEEVGFYTAICTPTIATLPVTLTWDNGTVGPTATYSWTVPGTYTLVVTATNFCLDTCVVTETMSVTVCQPVEDVTVNGPGSLLTEEVGFYTAICTPTIATLPVTLTWDNGTVGPTATYSWTVPGTYTLVVTATNFCLDTCVVTETMNVVVTDRLYPIYLPLVMRSCY